MSRGYDLAKLHSRDVFDAKVTHFDVSHGTVKIKITSSAYSRLIGREYSLLYKYFKKIFPEQEPHGEVRGAAPGLLYLINNESPEKAKFVRDSLIDDGSIDEIDLSEILKDED